MVYCMLGNFVHKQRKRENEGERGMPSLSLANDIMLRGI